MELVVVNGSSAIARGVVRSIINSKSNTFTKIKLLDAKPFRQSVYQFQKNLPSGV